MGQMASFAVSQGLSMARAVQVFDETKVLGKLPPHFRKRLQFLLYRCCAPHALARRTAP